MRLFRGLCLALLLVACGQPWGVRYPQLPTVGDGALHIVIFDVGQADAMLIMYQGKTLLIDAGEARSERAKLQYDIPRRVRALTGSNHIDYFLISHFHRDHFGAPKNQRSAASGIFGLLDQSQLEVGQLLHRGLWSTRESAGIRNARILSERIPHQRELRAGDSVELGAPLSVSVVASAGNGYLDRLLSLAPALYKEYPPSENDYSVGLKLQLGDFEMFTGGDLSGASVLRVFGSNKESYNDMESRLAAGIGALEVYRVNHHGSRYSSNPCFVGVLMPQASIISAGINTYGHPSPEVVHRLKAQGDVWITGDSDRKYRESLAQDIVGGDIDLVVSADGSQFWINGKPYTSHTDAQESALRGDRPTSCPTPLDDGKFVAPAIEETHSDGAELD